MKRINLAAVVILWTASFSTHAQSTTAQSDSIKKIVDKHIANNFSGIVQVSKNNDVVFSQVSGYSDETSKTPLTLSTRSSIGSIGKLMTAVLVMKLVEEGKVDVNKTIDTYLPEWKIPNGNKITVAQLLQMKAGLGDYMHASEHHALRGKPASLDDLMKIVINQSPRGEPGVAFAYSNSGFIVLGKLVEKLEGKTYFDVLTQRILRPSNIKSATFNINLDDAKGFAKGYTFQDGQWKPQTSIIPPASDGGLFISFEDFLKFDKALYEGKIISKETLEKMRPVDPDNYGFGTMRTKVTNGIGYGHNGGMPGYEAEYRHFFIGSDQYTILIFANHDRTAMGMLRDLKAIFDMTSAAQSNDKAGLEERAKAMIAALNTGSRSDYKKFIQANYTQELISKKMTAKIIGPEGESADKAKEEDALESKVTMYERLHQDLGEGKISSIKHDGDKLLMEVSGSTGTNLSFMLTFAKEGPYLINGFSIQMMLGR